KDTSLAVIDPKTGGAIMTFGTPLPASKAAHPTWSPDGSLVAFINNISAGGGAAGWAVDYDHGDVAVIAVSTGDTFGAPQTLVANSTAVAAFAAPSWPTFTTDSQWIAYGAGTNSRGRNTVNNAEVVYPGSLFLVGRAGGTPTRLDNACSGARNCYLP